MPTGSKTRSIEELQKILREDRDFMGSVVNGKARASSKDIYAYVEDSARRISELLRPTKNASVGISHENSI